MHWLLLWLTLTLALSWVQSLVAVAARADELTCDHLVSESAFLAALNEAHPAVVALTEDLGRARSDRKQAGILANPDFGVEVEAPEGATRQTTWSVAWRPPLDGRRGLQVRAGEAAENAARLDLEAEKLELRQQLRAVYAQWAIANARTETVDSHLQFVEGLVSQMRARATAGEESGLAARRFDLARIAIETELARAEADLLRARSDVAGWRPDLSSEAQPTLPPLPEVTPEPDLMSRPDLAARRQDVEAGEARSQLARRFLEFPTLGIGWQQQDEGEQEFEGPTYALSWDVPLFDRRQADRIGADTQLTAAKARLDHSTALARAEVEGARAAYARLRRTALETWEAVNATDPVIESTTTSYRLGEASVTDLLETLRSVLASRISALDLYGDALAAHRNLERITGRPLTAMGEER